jgi:hypothetical protein
LDKQTPVSRKAVIKAEHVKGGQPKADDAFLIGQFH